jgi:DNA-binding NarL/FixJ family response regulator
MSNDLSFNRKLRIFLVEDHHIMRRGLASLLKTEIGAEIVGEASDGIAALELLADCRPDVLFMDIAMPRMNGIEATRRIKQKYPAARILILSMYNSPALVSQALQAGASGYLLKDSMVEDLTSALETVMMGRVYISPLIEGPVTGISDPALINSGLPKTEELTKREYEILQYLAEGKSVAQIAEALTVSIYTIYTHKSNIKQKLNLSSQAEIMRYAIDHAPFLNENRGSEP